MVTAAQPALVRREASTAARSEATAIQGRAAAAVAAVPATSGSVGLGWRTVFSWPAVAAVAATTSPVERVAVPSAPRAAVPCPLLGGAAAGRRLQAAPSAPATRMAPPELRAWAGPALLTADGAPAAAAAAGSAEAAVAPLSA